MDLLENRVCVGNFEYEMHGPNARFGEMTDSTALWNEGDVHGLRERLSSDGYLLLRGIVSREKIQNARNVVMNALHERFKVVDCSNDRTVDDGWIGSADKKGVLLTGYRPVTHQPEVLSVVESDELATVMSSLFGEAAATFDNKWVRVHGTNELTDEHTDYYRFAESANRMCTCWLPLGDYNPFSGTLVVCEGSHSGALNYSAADYGARRSELPPNFHNFNNTRKPMWRSTNFTMGDLVVFDIRLVHASTKNTTDHFRVSVDTRWQPASCVPEKCAPHFRTLQVGSKQ